MIPDGYTDVAPGKIAAVVTYVEMLERPQASAVISPGVSLRRAENPELDWYRNIYCRAGAEWLWFSRLQMTGEQVMQVLRRPTTELYIAQHDGNEIGMAELDRSKSPDVEITSFGLFHEAIGRGLGSAFMTLLLERAWRGETSRVWLHTCTLDSPAALTFYRKCGFRPYKRGIEIADDPRLRGFLPADVAPQVPIIR
jgi:N-acetylglutamate synthase-like GNAT family acetyltransferase